MKFKLETLSDGSKNRSRLLSECGNYAIRRYTWFNGYKTKPYYVGYHRKSGARITETYPKAGKNFKAVINSINNAK